MHSFPLSESCSLVIDQGDLTLAPVEAIVNAANERMLGGGGVDGAIHRAAGPRLLAACEAVPEVTPGVRCPTGEARITPGFLLAAKHVIHTVGPVYESADVSERMLRLAHRSSLRLARANRLASIAFPAISCGVFGYPPGEAAALALDECRAESRGLKEIRFVLFGAEMYGVWERAARALLTDR